MTRSKVGRSIANSGRRAGVRPGPVIRPAGGGRSFPPAAGSFRTVRRLTCFASSTSSYQSAPPTRGGPPRSGRYSP